MRNADVKRRERGKQRMRRGKRDVDRKIVERGEEIRKNEIKKR